ncbi:4-hydroxyphenylacetate 3-hydroxylase C-terminal domain-containing protein [Aestuariivirga sp.]|uniref:4-hydroxyphenylacetate 3-hydroxylase C-terminal domain-containing protein n=1 Tax=Aestuariivirga sp. TaxID=2650926 RepID=UPI0039E4F02A
MGAHRQPGLAFVRWALIASPAWPAPTSLKCRLIQRDLQNYSAACLRPRCYQRDCRPSARISGCCSSQRCGRPPEPLALARDLLNSDYAGHRLTFQLFAQSPPFAQSAAVYRTFDWNSTLKFAQKAGHFFLITSGA